MVSNRDGQCLAYEGTQYRRLSDEIFCRLRVKRFLVRQHILFGFYDVVEQLTTLHVLHYQK